MSDSGRISLSPWVALCGLGALAVGVLAWGLPSAYRFVLHAPAEFWVMALLAVAVDTPLFTDQRSNVRTRPTLSTAICFAIFLLWGLGPALLAQVVAATVSAIGQSYKVIGAVLLVCRLVLAFGVAHGLTLLIDTFPASTRTVAPTPANVAAFLELAGIWFVAAAGALLAGGMAVTRRGFRRQMGRYRDELLTTIAAVLGVTPLLVILPPWWSLIAVLPLFAANLALRERLRDEYRLRRDPVTGLQGRSGLLAYIDTITAQDGIRVQPFGVALVHAAQSVPDIARSLGRDIYERVAVEAASRLLQDFDESQIGRLTGEGFAIVAPGLARNPMGLANRAVCAFNTPMEVKGIPFSIHSAAGVALSPEHGRDLETLLIKAELAASEAHREGRRVVIYAPETATMTQRRVALVTELHATLADRQRRQEITLLYQPQVHIRTGRLAGVEGLLRWTHPQWGPVPTEQLVEACENTEVMHELTRYLVDVVARQLEAWNQQGFRIRASLNATVEDLLQESFPEEVARALSSRGVAPHQLTVEITERTITTGSVRVSRAAQRLADLGVGLSIDDFGTGYASLQQVRVLPVTEVKIDRSYVVGLLQNRSERAIVTSVYELARALGLDVVAEGVEDEEMAAALAKLPDTIGQGWHFGRPIAAAAIYDEWHDRIQAGASARLGSRR